MKIVNFIASHFEQCKIWVTLDVPDNCSEESLLELLQQGVYNKQIEEAWYKADETGKRSWTGNSQLIDYYELPANGIEVNL